MSHPEKRICSLQRLQFIHMAMCLISIIALILASDSCYKIFLGPDRCQHSAYGYFHTAPPTFYSRFFWQVLSMLVL
jgi:hypothetical protein